MQFTPLDQLRLDQIIFLLPVAPDHREIRDLDIAYYSKPANDDLNLGK